MARKRKRKGRRKRTTGPQDGAASSAPDKALSVQISAGSAAPPAEDAAWSPPTREPDAPTPEPVDILSGDIISGTIAIGEGSQASKPSSVLAIDFGSEQPSIQIAEDYAADAADPSRHAATPPVATAKPSAKPKRRPRPPTPKPQPSSSPGATAATPAPTAPALLSPFRMLTPIEAATASTGVTTKLRGASGDVLRPKLGSGVDGRMQVVHPSPFPPVIAASEIAPKVNWDAAVAGAGERFRPAAFVATSDSPEKAGAPSGKLQRRAELEVSPKATARLTTPIGQTPALPPLARPKPPAPEPTPAPRPAPPPVVDDELPSAASGEISVPDAVLQPPPPRSEEPSVAIGDELIKPPSADPQSLVRADKFPERTSEPFTRVEREFFEKDIHATEEIDTFSDLVGDEPEERGLGRLFKGAKKHPEPDVPGSTGKPPGSTGQTD